MSTKWQGETQRPDIDNDLKYPNMLTMGRTLTESKGKPQLSPGLRYIATITAGTYAA